MKVEIKGGIRDILSFILHIKARNRIFRRTPAGPVPAGKMNLLSESLHPLNQDLVIESVSRETENTFTYRLKGVDRKPAFFLSGQYISIGFKVGQSTVYRPFSISSLPGDVLNEGSCEITVKIRESGGFVDSWIGENWREGTRIAASGPAGNFTYQRLRDSRILVCIAGGSGITPFKPLISSLLSDDPGVRIILFYGAAGEEKLIFDSFWKQTVRESGGRFYYYPVLSEPDKEWKGLRGFITSGLIRIRLESDLNVLNSGDCSYFICGPEGLHRHMDIQLKDMNVPRRRTRREEYAVNTLPAGKDSVTGPVIHKIVVRRNDPVLEIEAAENETVLVALERAGLNPPSLCRSGECGWCRSRLVSGEITPVVKGSEDNIDDSAAGIRRESGLRKADEKFGYFHPCSVFPRGDLVIQVPGNPIGKE